MTCSAVKMTFAGCDVIDFSASAGWNSQLTEVTINAAGCPSCAIAEVGTLHTFKAGKFEFRGLLQSWNKSEDSSGRPIYSYKLVSPHPILEYTQVILGEYQGNVQNIGNIANVYGYVEKQNSNGTCNFNVINATEFGSDPACQGFGGANRTARGMPWYLIRQGLQALLSGTSSNFCHSFGFMDTKCTIDLSSLPIANQSYRISGPTLSLSDLINQVCEDGGCDWYAQFMPGTNVIKINTISRTSAPSLGAIDSFVSDNLKISSSIGRELRAETHSSMLIGGNKRQYYPCIDAAQMEPFWGWDLDGIPIQGKTDPTANQVCGYEVYLDFRKINLALYTKIPNNPHDIYPPPHPMGSSPNRNAPFWWVGENELRAAMGNYESFIANIVGMMDREDDCEDVEEAVVDGTASVLTWYFACALGVYPPLRDASPERPIDKTAGTVDTDVSGNIESTKVRDAKALHSWLQSFANDFYGKQFVVYFSLDTVICRSYDNETQQPTYSDEISPEGAWPVAEDVLGMPLEISLGVQNDLLTIFRDMSGKVQPMIKFPVAGINTKALNVSDFVSDGAHIWVKASVDADWVYGTPEWYESPYTHGPDKIVCALVKLSSPLLAVQGASESLESNTLVDQFKRTGQMATNPNVSTVANRLGAQAETARALGPPAALYPTAIGVPMKSNTRCYGPWVAKAADLQRGCAQVQIDDGLVPWEYGGPLSMIAAGYSQVNNAVTTQYAQDRGSITVPGLPTLNLGSNVGEESRLWGAFNTAMGRSWPEFNNQTSAGAVISNIQVSIGGGGITTTYDVSSFTPVYGRFSKGNAARLKQIGINRLKAGREASARAALSRLLQGGQGGGGGGGGGSNIARESSTDIAKGSIAPAGAPIWFAGTKDGTTRKSVLTPTANTMSYYKNYNQTAIMTMDGFFRPVATPGDSSNLPKVNSTYGAACAGGVVPTQTPAPPPPNISDGDGDAYAPLPIFQQKLDFLTDKVHYGASWIEDPRWSLQDVNSGHDIEGVARKTINTVHDGDKASEGRLVIQPDDPAGIPDYAEDYRFMALRGPLVIQGWGYDVHGKPIPNEKDGGSSFSSSYAHLSDKFQENYLQEADTWPIAPVDLRFDRKRGVWTIPPSYRMFQVKTSGDLSINATGPASIIANTDDLYDGSGDFIANPTIQLRNWTDNHLSSGTTALAYYDTTSCEYWVVSAASGSSGNVRVAYSGCDTGHDCYTLPGCILFSTGISFTQWSIAEDRPASRIDDVGYDILISGPSIASTPSTCDTGSLSCGEQNRDGCSGEGVPAQAFDLLTFGSGLTLLQDGSGSCSWTLHANDAICGSGSDSGSSGGITKVGYTGCDGEGIECINLSGCLVFSSGITFTQWDATGNRPTAEGEEVTAVHITGPSIAGQSSQNGEGEEKETKGPFDLLTFGSGLELVSGEKGTCSFTVNASGGGMVGYNGCSGAHVACSPVECTIFSSGLGFTVGDSGAYISGPSIAYPLGNIEASPFDVLSFGSGMSLEKSEGGGCLYTAHAFNDGYSGVVTVVTSICCSGDQLTIEYSGLSFSDGLLKSVVPGEIPDCNSILC